MKRLWFAAVAAVALAAHAAPTTVTLVRWPYT